jgi:hypothetical protein
MSEPPPSPPSSPFMPSKGAAETAVSGSADDDSIHVSTSPSQQPSPRKREPVPSLASSTPPSPMFSAATSARSGKRKEAPSVESVSRPPPYGLKPIVDRVPIQIPEFESAQSAPEYSRAGTLHCTFELSCVSSYRVVCNVVLEYRYFLLDEIFAVHVYFPSYFCSHYRQYLQGRQRHWNTAGQIMGVEIISRSW